jgi:uncharacterized membrane protein
MLFQNVEQFALLIESANRTPSRKSDGARFQTSRSMIEPIGRRQGTQLRIDALNPLWLENSGQICEHGHTPQPSPDGFISFSHRFRNYGMSLTLPLAQVEMRPENVLSFVGFTFVFLLVLWLADDRNRALKEKLILWGIFVEILAIGYGLIGVPGVIIATPALTRIGFLLVIGGVAASFLSNDPAPTANKEANHV